MQDRSMSQKALIMGSISIALSLLLGGGLLFGLLGILFALLSRGACQMDEKAKTGLILSSVGCVLSVIMTIILLLAVFASKDILENYTYELEEYMYDDYYEFYDDTDGFDTFFDYNFDFDYDRNIYKGGYNL